MRRFFALIVVLGLLPAVSATFVVNDEPVNFGVQYETKMIDADEYVVLSQEELPFASVDYVGVLIDGEVLPVSAMQGTVDVSEKLSDIDLDVINVHDKPVMLELPAPGTLIVHANEYGHALPLRWPAEGFTKVPMKDGSFVVDGSLDEVGEPAFAAFLQPVTGHPAGNVYGYVRSDGEHVYVALDVTIDNTNEPGEDWAALTVKMWDGVKRFYADTQERQFGVSAFEYTPAVDYQHKTYEFRLPVDAGAELEFFLEYYGTAGGGCGDGIVQPPEECDDGNPFDGDGCSSSCLLEKDVGMVLHDLRMAHNLLFSKVQDLAHINKHEAFQIETKLIQQELIQSFASERCEELPLLFAMQASDHPYGKLREVNALNNFWLSAIGEDLDAFGVSQSEFDNAENLESQAETNANNENFISAAKLKCCAYNQLLTSEILSFDGDACSTCGDGVRDLSEQCDDGNNVDGDGCSAICRKEPPGPGGGQSGGTQAEASCCYPTANDIEYACCAVSLGVNGVNCCAEPDAPQCQSVCVAGPAPESPTETQETTEQQTTTTEAKPEKEAESSGQCTVDDDCSPGFACVQNKCVRTEPAAPAPEQQTRAGSMVSTAATAGLALLALLALLLLMLRSRPKQTTVLPKPQKKAKEPHKEVHKEAEDLEQAYQRIDEMLKKMRRRL